MTLGRAIRMGLLDTVKMWGRIEAVTFGGWAIYKTYRLFYPKDGVLTPNTMKLWSQYAYVNNPVTAAAFWTQVPWTWEEQ